MKHGVAPRNIDNKCLPGTGTGYLVPEAEHGPVSVEHGQTLVQQELPQLLRVRLLQRWGGVHRLVHRLVVFTTSLVDNKK